jgi:hypothetical protein
LVLVQRQLAAMGIVLAATCAVMADQLQVRHKAAKAAKTRRRHKSRHL